jgi:hypothetical protein
VAGRLRIDNLGTVCARSVTAASARPVAVAPHTEEPKPDSSVDLIQHDGTLNQRTKQYGDWHDEFHKTGVAVVKGVVTPERAAYYRQKQVEWLQSFGLGFDPNGESTWTQEHLPVAFKSGLRGLQGYIHTYIHTYIRLVSVLAV